MDRSAERLGKNDSTAIQSAEVVLDAASSALRDEHSRIHAHRCRADFNYFSWPAVEAAGFLPLMCSSYQAR